MDVDQVVLDVARPDFLLVGAEAQPVAAAPFATALVGNEVLNRFYDFAVGYVGHLEAEHIVDVLEEQPFVAGNGRRARDVLERDFADDFVARFDIDHRDGVGITHR